MATPIRTAKRFHRTCISIFASSELHHETLTLQTPNTLLPQHKQTKDFLPRWVLRSSPALGTCVMCRPRPASKANIWKRNRILVKPGAELMLFALKTFLKNSPERIHQCWKIPSLFLSLLPRSGPFPSQSLFTFSSLHSFLCASLNDNLSLKSIYSFPNRRSNVGTA